MNRVCHIIPPRQAWPRLTRMQQMVAQEPALARAVRYKSLYDQLDLTLEVLHMDGNTSLDDEPAEPWPCHPLSNTAGSLMAAEARRHSSHARLAPGPDATFAPRHASWHRSQNAGSRRRSRPLSARSE